MIEITNVTMAGEDGFEPRPNIDTDIQNLYNTSI